MGSNPAVDSRKPDKFYIVQTGLERDRAPKRNKMEKTIITCDCSDLSHSVQFAWFPEDRQSNIDYLYVTTLLNRSAPWYKRIYYGLRYIFTGDTSKYGISQETCLTPDQVIELRDICDSFLGNNDVEENS